MSRLFSYVVDHDEGLSPHPSGRYCTLVHCKFNRSGKRRNVVELAEKGDWVVGTGGTSTRSAGRGRIIYAMKVTGKLPMLEYLASAKFKRRLDNHSGADAERRFALISTDFFYFGRNAPEIPSRFRTYPLEKTGRAFRNGFDKKFIEDFEKWIRGRHVRGIQGEPCSPRPDFRAARCVC